jgi:predicted RNase H-like nuclease (RuvC/YqgF family)
MAPLSISYQAFMDLSCEDRDELLSQHIIDSSSPYVQRLLAPHKENNSREVIARMGDRITELEIENEKLNQTIEWMHQTIWELVRKNKGMVPDDKINPDQGIDP